ncbi:MAG: iron ABC transporter permease [Halobacteria archaeon]|nr:iron ABC transporter permease [Halobacteria archaeon]
MEHDDEAQVRRGHRRRDTASSLIRHGLLSDGSAGLKAVSLIIGILVVSPLVWLVVRASEVEYSRAVDLVLSASTLGVFLNSIGLVFGVTVLSVLIGVPAAFLTVRTDVPFRRLWTVVLSLPLVVPSYIGAFAFVSASSPRGFFGWIPTPYGFVGAVVVLTLYTYPYVYITTRASLKSFDTSLVDAARTLNASKWEAFRKVTVPHILPAVGAGSLLVALYALSDFGTPAIMRFDSFTRVIYNEYNAMGRNFAALLSVQLLLVTFVILGAESYLSAKSGSGSGGNARGAGAGAGGKKKTRLVSLGVWRLPAAAACGSVGLVALGLPIGILVSWLLRDSPSYASSLAFEASYAFNSVYVSLGAALVAGVAAVPVAYLSARDDSRLSSLIERSTYIGYATPGIVVGLALVYLGVLYLRPLYQTVPLLVFAYVVRFLPQSVGSTRSSVLQVNSSLPEAARSLGRSKLGAFLSVTLPLIAPGVLGGAALVFLTTMKELPATLMLRPTGFKTLATHIWTVQVQGYYGYAAVSALILVLISGVSMIVMISQEGYDVE